MTLRKFQSLLQKALSVVHLPKEWLILLFQPLREGL